MDYEIEIPFGAYDSELMRQEIYIPEGFEATIEGNRIILTRIENDDEKVRKWLIDTLKGYHHLFEEGGVTKEDMLAWLEKKGEQNHFEQDLEMEVKPKFKVGDWITNGLCTWRIDSINGEMYYGNGVDPGEYFENVDAEYRLWSIQDAKKGDVLVASDDSLFIFARVKDNAAYYHYSLCKNGSQEISDGKHSWEVAKSCHPATKEQRDLLFQKMREAGYEWNENNKMLKEIVEDEEEPQNYKNQVMSEITDLVKHYIRQKPVWSEEDDGMFDTMEGWLDTLCEYLNDSSSECIPNVESCINWFKSLKERFLPQPKQDWTEEDEHRAEDTIYFLDTAKKHYASTVELDACIDWLKAIKDRYSWKPSSELDETSYQVGIKRVLENPESYGLTKYNWKPSDEQMNALSVAVKHGQTDDPDALKKLLEQLKKLKGE